MFTKRLSFLFSLAIVLSMILSACTAPAAPTAAPAQPTAAPAQPTAAPAQPTEAPAQPTEAPAQPPAAAKGYKIGFLAGVQDPFYFTMQRGAMQAAADLGVELVVQIPDNWNATVQTPMLDAMVARGDLDLIFLAPVDKEAMISPLQKAYDAGVPIITVDTFIGDGDYENGPVTFPLSFIASDNKLGGVIACKALVEAIGGKGKIYIQNVKIGISSTDAREEGCKEAIQDNPDVTLVGVDYNDDDPSKAQAQVEAMLQKEPDLAGIFGTNVFSAQGAGQVVANKGLSGKVKVVAFDATETAIEMLKATTVDLVIAQKPGDMGYLAMLMAMAYLNGVTSIPKHIPTGYQIITRDNMNDPAVQKFFYTK
jgi:ribose transport system substrate-binding protein